MSIEFLGIFEKFFAKKKGIPEHKWDAFINSLLVAVSLNYIRALPCPPLAQDRLNFMYASTTSF